MCRGIEVGKDLLGSVEIEEGSVVVEFWEVIFCLIGKCCFRLR